MFHKNIFNLKKTESFQLSEDCRAHSLAIVDGIQGGSPREGHTHRQRGRLHLHGHLHGLPRPARFIATRLGGHVTYDAPTWPPCMSALCRLVEIATMLRSWTSESHVEQAMLVSVLEQPRLDKDHFDAEEDVMDHMLSVQAMSNKNPIILVQH